MTFRQLRDQLNTIKDDLLDDTVYFISNGTDTGHADKVQELQTMAFDYYQLVWDDEAEENVDSDEIVVPACHLALF